MGDANNNRNNFNVVFVGWIGGSIHLVVDGKIVKILTGTKVGDAKKILTKALPGKIKNADNMAISWEPKG